MFYLRRSEIGDADLQLGFCAGCFSLCKHNPVCLWSPGTTWRKAALIGVHAFMQTLHSAGVRSTNQPPGGKKKKKTYWRRTFQKQHLVTSEIPLRTHPLLADQRECLQSGTFWPHFLQEIKHIWTSIIYSRLWLLPGKKQTMLAINSVAWLNLHHGKMGHETRHPATETRGKGKAQLPQLYLGTLVLRYAQWNCSLQGERRYQEEKCVSFWQSAGIEPKYLRHLAPPLPRFTPDS